MAALSILTVISHHREHVHHASIVLHHSRTAARLIPAPSQQHLANREHGTRVNVQDLFGNMPVRVKQRALESTNGESEKQYEILKRQIAGLLLAWHLPVSIRLKITGSKKELHVRENGLRVQDDQKATLRRRLDLSLVYSTLSQFGYIEKSGCTSWVKTSARTPFITINGAISLQPAPSKQVQFISLGLHSILAEKGGNVLYDEVNRIFAASSFGKQELPNDEGIRNAKEHDDRRFKQEGFTSKQVKGEGKGVDRWPMFYIRIDWCNVDHGKRDNIENLAEGTLTGLLKVLGAMIAGFLNENHFRPRVKPVLRKRPTSSLEGKQPENSRASGINIYSSSKKANKHQDGIFANWGRIKSGVRVKSLAALPSLSSPDRRFLQAKENSLEVSAPSSEPGGATQLCDSTNVSQYELSRSQDDKTVNWINPVSGAAVLINARTGLVVDPLVSRRPRSAPLHSSSFSAPFTAKYSGPKHPNRLTRTASAPEPTSSAASWTRDLLKTWKNPVFATTEEAIPQVLFDGPSIETSIILHGRHHCCSEKELQHAFTQSSMLFSAKLSRQALKEAHVISQVDQKFVLVSMPVASRPHSDSESSRQLLVLIDQHAADERIRVETLLADLGSSPTTLTKPITFEISIREKKLLARRIPHFTSWGIVYDVTVLHGSTQCRVKVIALPAAIAERCRIEPKLLIELLRGEAWRREELGIVEKAMTADDSALQANSDAKKGDWLSRLSDCPPGLLDMLNSRACRSAIMFNDDLSKAECGILVQRLSECAFPFQCAHGRPSMVPLVNVNSAGMGSEIGKEGLDTTYPESKDRMERTFGEAWKEWRAIRGQS